jgi:glycosyltransferase involved in cell wall biosynthesis
MWLLGEPPVEVPWPVRTLYPSWALTGRPRLPEALATADVVHATNPAAVPPAGRDRRLVVTVHDLAFERFPALFPPEWRWLYRAGLRAAARRADAILVPSESTADDVIRGSSVDPTRVHVTPLAPSFAATGEDPDVALERLGVRKPFVLSVGTLEPRKNLIRLVRAYRQVAPDVPHALVLAGPTGWHATELEAELSRPGPGTIVRAGRVDGGQLTALYRSADAFAYVSLYEGFGLPVVEAMSAGAPVVASNTSSIPEVAGDAALLVDPEDVGAIADALARVLSDPELADDLRRRGREHAAGYTWDRTARATLDVYRQVTGAS